MRGMGLKTDNIYIVGIVSLPLHLIIITLNEGYLDKQAQLEDVGLILPMNPIACGIPKLKLPINRRNLVSRNFVLNLTYLNLHFYNV